MSPVISDEKAVFSQWPQVPNFEIKDGYTLKNQSSMSSRN
jgi:hypothetical protein